MATKYSSREAAKAAAKKAPIFKGKPTYTYRCTTCKAYHVGIRTDAPHHVNRTNCSYLGEIKIFTPKHERV